MKVGKMHHNKLFDIAEFYSQRSAEYGREYIESVGKKDESVLREIWDDIIIYDTRAALARNTAYRVGALKGRIPSEG